MRIYHLFYLTALIAAALNLFGGFGIVIGCLIAGAWFYIFSRNDQSRQRNAFDVMVVLAILSMFSCCIDILPGEARYAARRMQCANNLKQIGLALHNYHSFWKRLPPAVTYDSDGRPMHSWRVLILPYLEEKPLYEAYSMDEPWNGPNNVKLLNRMPSIFRCPCHPVGDFSTGYCAIIGERTCFPPSRSREFNEILDGTANTMMVVESSHRGPWMAASDPTLDKFTAEVKHWLPANTPHSHSELLTHYDSGGNSLIADGSIQFVSGSVDSTAIEKFLVIDDGALTEQERNALSFPSSKPTRMRWEGYLAVVVLVFLAVLPAFQLFHRESPSPSGDSASRDPL